MFACDAILVFDSLVSVVKRLSCPRQRIDQNKNRKEKIAVCKQKALMTYFFFYPRVSRTIMRSGSFSKIKRRKKILQLSIGIYSRYGTAIDLIHKWPPI